MGSFCPQNEYYEFGSASTISGALPVHGGLQEYILRRFRQSDQWPSLQHPVAVLRRIEVDLLIIPPTMKVQSLGGGHPQ
ncbi:hypothetical protein Plhal703r1_c37g0133841 [Plasmopara halstedii]